MKPMHPNNPTQNDNQQSCKTENKDCSCSNGMCPGTILGGVLLFGWGLYTLGTWVWGVFGG